jgi:hypothetical protein
MLGAGIAQSVYRPAIGWTVRVLFPAGAGAWAWICLFSTAPRPTLGPNQPPIQWVPGALSPGVKRPRREIDHSPQSRVGVKIDGGIPPLPPYVFM